MVHIVHKDSCALQVFHFSSFRLVYISDIIEYVYFSGNIWCPGPLLDALKHSDVRRVILSWNRRQICDIGLTMCEFRMQRRQDKNKTEYMMTSLCLRFVFCVSCTPNNKRK